VLENYISISNLNCDKKEMQLFVAEHIVTSETS
jgi:hypothetical protein